MSSLPEHVRRIEAIRPRSIGAAVTPYLGPRAGTIPARYVEEAALTILASALQQDGPLREQLLTERPRFERLTSLVYRAPERRGGE
jgi:hypothetical protein